MGGRPGIFWGTRLHVCVSPSRALEMAPLQRPGYSVEKLVAVFDGGMTTMQRDPLRGWLCPRASKSTTDLDSWYQMHTCALVMDGSMQSTARRPTWKLQTYVTVTKQ